MKTAAFWLGALCALDTLGAAHAEPPPQLILRAERLVASRCSQCHGINGEVAGESFPRLAGRDREYLARQLRDFRSGARRGQMTELVRDLSDDEIVALGTLFSRIR